MEVYDCLHEVVVWLLKKKNIIPIDFQHFRVHVCPCYYVVFFLSCMMTHFQILQLWPLTSPLTVFFFKYLQILTLINGIFLIFLYIISQNMWVTKLSKIKNKIDLDFFLFSTLKKLENFHLKVAKKGWLYVYDVFYLIFFFDCQEWEVTMKIHIE